MHIYIYIYIYIYEEDCAIAGSCLPRAGQLYENDQPTQSLYGAHKVKVSWFPSLDLINMNIERQKWASQSGSA
jgi:hypothetical protein